MSRRLTEPDLDPGELARVDAVVLSHLHGDHWDRRARRRLSRSLPIVTTRTPPAASRACTGSTGPWGCAPGRRRPCGTGTAGAYHLAAGRHTGHPVLRRLLPPVMGSLLEFGPAVGPAHHRLYVSGDTLLFDGLDEIGRRFPGLDLVVLHLGGTTLPGGFVVTMDGRQGAELARRLDPA
ncbi:hypothetical protein ID867_23640 [Streptomyces parvulus]|nr:hypothetical protein [Streptomyces parvulus]